MYWIGVLIKVKNLGKYIFGTLVVAAVIIVSVGTYYADRWVNYKLSYQGMVAEQIKPLELRLKALEDAQNTNSARAE